MKLNLVAYPEAAPAPPVGDEIRKYVLAAKKDIEEMKQAEAKK